MPAPVAEINFFLFEPVILSTAKKFGSLAYFGGWRVLVFLECYITPVFAGRDLFLEPEALRPAV
jgi:hypothetical protein